MNFDFFILNLKMLEFSRIVNISTWSNLCATMPRQTNTEYGTEKS